LDALKRIEKIIPENAFEQEEKKSGLKFNPGLAPIDFRTTRPWFYFGVIISKMNRQVSISGISNACQNKKKEEKFSFLYIGLLRYS